MDAVLFQTFDGLLASVVVLGLIVGIATSPGPVIGRVRATNSRSVSRRSPPLGARRMAAFAAGAAMLGITNIASAADEKRVALVIGNGAYENAPRLDNPAFDAKAVADAFRRLGFQVVDGYDLNIEKMRAKVSEFSAALPDARSAVIYYAGHGISVDEENYLIPTDITLRSPTDLDLGAISVSLVLKQMKREDRVNVVILDACRDNPFAAVLAKNKTRAIVGERGLSRIDGDLARGTLIAFASDPKSTALDGGAGQHSPFTEAFLAHVFDSGVSIETVMSRVRTEVWEKTRHNQLPWVNTSLIGDYALNPQVSPQVSPQASPQASSQTAPEGAADVAKAPAPPPTPAPPGDKQSHEDLLWESAQHSNLSADYQAYLDAFPNGVFAQMAKNRIASLQGADAAAAARTSEKVAAAEPVAPSQKDWKAEIGSVDTEKALDLTPADQKEIQQRLIALELLKGPATGAFDSSTRAAIAEWQKSRGVAATTFLGSMQLTELRAESEAAYQRFLSAQSAPRQAPAIRTKHAAVKPTTRAVKAPEPAPARRVTKRASSPAAATAAGAAPAAPSDPGGTPAWRKRAGLPDNAATDGSGAAAGFWTGAATGAAAGFMLGKFRHQ